MKLSESDRTVFACAATLIASVGVIGIVGVLFPLLLEVIF